MEYAQPYYDIAVNALTESDAALAIVKLITRIVHKVRGGMGDPPVGLSDQIACLHKAALEPFLSLLLLSQRREN